MKYSVIFLCLLFFGFTKGQVTKVAIIDTGLDLSDPRFVKNLCPSGHKDFTDEGITDTHGHGTHIAGLIRDGAGNSSYCLIIVKYYGKGSSYKDGVSKSTLAVEWAVNSGATVVNYSGGGGNYDVREYNAIRNHPEITFIVAAGNEDHDIGEVPYYPASYRLPNVVPVGNLSLSGERYPSSNYGALVKTWEIGDNVLSDAPCLTRGDFVCKTNLTGTSQATAVHTGKVVRGGK